MSTPERLLYVEWEDASAVDDHTGWVDRASAPEPEVRVFKQVGFALKFTATELILTEAIDQLTHAPRTRIPTGMLRKVIELDPAKGKPVRIPHKRKSS